MKKIKILVVLAMMSAMIVLLTACTETTIEDVTPTTTTPAGSISPNSPPITYTTESLRIGRYYNNEYAVQGGSYIEIISDNKCNFVNILYTNGEEVSLYDASFLISQTAIYVEIDTEQGYFTKIDYVYLNTLSYYNIIYKL
ncbi:MAG: hypothetical protein LBT30_02360 [Clostridiales bacterium]|jgi:hypothetical protein|nr:hypothetical protein [Clostridiales bacterium]